MFASITCWSGPGIGQGRLGNMGNLAKLLLSECEARAQIGRDLGLQVEVNRQVLQALWGWAQDQCE